MNSARMYNRKPYERRSTLFSAWTLKAIGLVIAAATTTFVVLAIAKAISFAPDPIKAGNFVGVRHEAGSIPSAANTSPRLSTPGPDHAAELSSDTVMRNGVTVVSPQLRVPVIDIDIDSTGTAKVSAAAPSSKSSNARKRSRYANRSRSHHRWKAYGLALR